MACNHWLGRPHAGAYNVLKLTDDGWVPDDGEPGIAFSGKGHKGFPVA